MLFRLSFSIEREPRQAGFDDVREHAVDDQQRYLDATRTEEEKAEADKKKNQ